MSRALTSNEAGGMSRVPALYRVDHFCEAHGISRSTFYREVRSGRLHIIKLGPNSTGVLMEEARRWLQSKFTEGTEHE
jgi:predicted DNA-binding transcriptional regulator AlpA